MRPTRWFALINGNFYMVDYLNNRVLEIYTLLIYNTYLLPYAFHNIDFNKIIIKLINNINYLYCRDFDIVVQYDYQKIWQKHLNKKQSRLSGFKEHKSAT